MFIRNSDTGKWSAQTDTLSKDNYDSLKQDLDKVRLYSKCLSGSTYIPINSLNNIYDVLDINKIGYYIDQSNSQPYLPIVGPVLPLNSSNSNDFYNKYLEEYAFSLKNSFTPNKLIQDQLNNFLEVDVATTLPLNNIGQSVFNLVIDEVRLKEGHRVLVKNQISQINLSSSINAENYFTITNPVATYSILSNNVTNILYQYYNSENGIYTYTNNKLIKTDDLDTYKKSYRYSINVKLGTQNREKQFHLTRLKNGYYPVGSENQNLYFEEKNNWVLRHRVDYNNIFDINYYDILHHSTQSVFVEVDSRTYSIPPRTIVVGEFGVIVDNQDNISLSSTYSQSNLITNKYKVNLRSIAEVEKYYWVCGDDGTLLRISKVDFSIQKIDLGETSTLTSISFSGNLNGMVVGKFNTIYYTQDGGDHWYKIENPEFDLYSYNKVVHYELNQAYIGGETGVFIELLYSSGNWLAFKRKISKQLNSLDEYMLVEDINDMSKTSWVKLLDSTHSEDQTSIDFGQSLILLNSVGNYYELVINLDSQYFTSSVFQSSTYLAALNVQDADGNTIYNNSLYNQVVSPGQWQSYDLYQYVGLVPSGTNTIKTIGTFSLPLDSDGNLQNTTFTINIDLFYNYDALSNSVLTGYNFLNISYDVKTVKGRMLLISSNNDNLINYDIDSIITQIDNQFIYYSSTQSKGDLSTIYRRPNSTEVFVGGDKLYNFQFTDFLNFGSTTSNLTNGSANLVEDRFINKLFLTNNNLYFCGNNSLMRFGDYTTFSNQLDPTFLNDLKSKLLFLDYDIASKLNFFTDDGEYRLATSITFSTSSLAYLYISNLSNEYNWLNYYKDSEKTFKYYSGINDNNKVEFSSTFSISTITNSFTFSGAQISINSTDILPIAPNITSLTQSKFIEDISNPIATNFDSNYEVLIQKELIIFKVNQSNKLYAEVGDILRLTSNIVDCNLMVNRIERYLKDTGTPLTPGIRITTWPTLLTSNQYVETYLYCYSNFNDNIIRNLKSTTTLVNVVNLNRYNNLSELESNFENHPISIGYKLDISNNILTLSQRFNNKTAYYNMQSLIETNILTYQMKYLDSFMDFGYSPQYNLLDYLSKIDSNIFTASSVFSIMPDYYNLTGNDGSTFTPNNIYIDLSEGPQVGTYSWYRNGTNKIMFGSNLKFYWDSLLLNTFIDLELTSTSFGTITNNQMLISNKYYDSLLDGYVIEFNKKIVVTNPNGFYVNTFNILSRNRLDEISEDLQLLNNIQRTESTRSVQYLNTFTNLENVISNKFYTDSYCKILASDYRIRENLSGLIYVDDEYQLSMNLFNVDKTLLYQVTGTNVSNSVSYNNKLLIYINGEHQLKIGDLIYVEFTGGTGSSEELNPHYFGYQTVINSVSSNSGFSYVVTSIDYGQASSVTDVGLITFRKKDSFFNYQAIDIFDLGVDKKVTRSVEILPENIEISNNKYNLINVDLTKYKMQFVDGLNLEEVNYSFGWLLEAEVSNAIVGKDKNGLVWYSGIWKCGRWFGGTWYSGSWVSGDWYDGIWNAFNTKYKVISVQIDNSYVDNSISKWFGGRWFKGTWNGGTWYNGRRYSGDWNGGYWYNGIWNDGNWKQGFFEGGVWVLGNWETGTFNCNSKPAYWLDGQFKSGDFENGIWYNGQFGNEKRIVSRFGTKSTNSRTSTWHGGRWIDGDFHSYLNVDSETNLPVVSDIHKYSIWRTGVWLKGNFYGGVAFNIDFRSGIWHGGILEEIQVIGVDPILPANTSNNSITLNGIFKFNIGDEVWIIDDDRNGAFSPIGSNSFPKKYRINEIEEFESIKQTKLFLNYNLSLLNVNSTIATQSYSNVETGLRVVSYFKDSTWNSGIWTNGIFVGGQFDSGIWYNGVFEGTWGN